MVEFFNDRHMSCQLLWFFSALLRLVLTAETINLCSASRVSIW